MIKSGLNWDFYKQKGSFLIILKVSADLDMFVLV